MPLTAADRWSALTPEQQAAALDAALPRTDPPAPAEPEPEPALAADGFAELTDFYDDTLKLRAPGGAEYVVRAVDVETGLMCQALVNLGLGALTNYNLGKRILRAEEGTEDTLDDSTEEALYRRLLGGDRDHLGEWYDPDHDVWAQLADRHAPWTLVRHMGITVLMWAGRDRDAAVDYWLSGARPKAPEPASAPQPKTPDDRRPSGKAGTARTTRKRVSTSSTTPPPRKGTPGPKS